MLKSAEELQQLKGVGRILGKRLYDAGFDSFKKIVEAGEEGLQKVRGINPRAVASILEQARQLSGAAHASATARLEAVQLQVAGMRDKIQTLAQVARDRFQEELAGKCGKKLSSDLIRIEDTLQRLADGGKKRAKRAGKVLLKAEKRVTGLEQASLKKLRKGLKRARKTVQKAL